jgi:hypothetical protein
VLLAGAALLPLAGCGDGHEYPAGFEAQAARGEAALTPAIAARLLAAFRGGTPPAVRGPAAATAKSAKGATEGVAKNVTKVAENVVHVHSAATESTRTRTKGLVAKLVVFLLFFGIPLAYLVTIIAAVFV